jgi:hypothetical protein
MTATSNLVPQRFGGWAKEFIAQYNNDEKQKKISKV